MALDFNIIQSKDCSKLEFQNCSTYCTSTIYSHDYLLAYISAATKISSSVSGSNVKYMLYGNALSTGSLVTFSWTVGAYTSSSQNMAVLLPVSTTTTITLVITDSNSLTSTTTTKIKLDASGNITWFASPVVNITPGADTTLSAYFADGSVLTTSTVDTATDSLALGDATTSTTVPVNHTYAATGTKSLTYEFDESEDGANVTVAFQYKLTATNTTCTAQLTEDNITEVLLKITDPDGTVETEDITDSFLGAPFYILQTDVTTLDFTNSGIWSFEVILTKTDGSVYIFSKCKNIVIFCDIKCKYSKLLAEKASLDKDCIDCEEVKLNQIFQISMLLDGLEDLIACNDTEGINNVITLLEALLSSTDCGCS